jgi:hypothetical protein
MPTVTFGQSVSAADARGRSAFCGAICNTIQAQDENDITSLVMTDESKVMSQFEAICFTVDTTD